MYKWIINLLKKIFYLCAILIILCKYEILYRWLNELELKKLLLTFNIYIGTIN